MASSHRWISCTAASLTPHSSAQHIITQRGSAFFPFRVILTLLWVCEGKGDGGIGDGEWEGSPHAADIPLVRGAVRFLRLVPDCFMFRYSNGGQRFI
ncbi:hypothetical protein BJY00DRAFT_200089 [Aspergillus carlsbadensis]|nr:hypothetical protein BJY00DRAFT_200089 [Aspergillus carlsbadensis]